MPVAALLASQLLLDVAKRHFELGRNAPDPGSRHALAHGRHAECRHGLAHGVAKGLAHRCHSEDDRVLNYAGAEQASFLARAGERLVSEAAELVEAGRDTPDHFFSLRLHDDRQSARADIQRPATASVVL